LIDGTLQPRVVFHYPELLDDWEAILSEMIIGDGFGADRMDYLLRDSLHAGVGYGRCMDTTPML